MSGSVGQESTFRKIVIVSSWSCLSLSIHLSLSLSFCLFQAGLKHTRSLLLGSRGSALLFQQVSRSETHHSYYSSGTNGRPTLWSMDFYLRHFYNSLDRIFLCPCSCLWGWFTSMFFHSFNASKYESWNILCDIGHNWVKLKQHTPVFLFYSP